MLPTANAAVAQPFAGASVGTEKTIHTLVIGIGNSLMTDDGAGIHVIDRLRESDLPAHVELVDGGTLGFTLLDLVESARRLIVVDAAQLEADPGTMQVFRDSEMDAYLTGCRRSSVHEVNLLDVIGAARFRGNMPPSYALVGIQPESVDWGAEPTEAVARGVEQATAAILDLIEEEQPA